MFEKWIEKGFVVFFAYLLLIAATVFAAPELRQIQDANSTSENSIRVKQVLSFDDLPDKDFSIENLREKAEQGDAIAQCNIGSIYAEGKGIEQNYREAVKWYTKAAEQGDASGQFYLGTMYEKGFGVVQDYEEAVKWYTRAAEKGLADAQFALAAIYANGRGVLQDYKEAIRWYTKAADGGHACRKSGIGLFSDLLAEMQAEQGLVEAQFALGVFYEHGYGVPQNDKEAIKWFAKAAERGIAEAQLYLGLSYAKGQGVRQNNEEAVKWFNMAADQGLAVAQFNLGLSYENGKGVAQDDKEAVKWFTKAAEQGYVNAQFNLGLIYSNNDDLVTNYKEAVKWYSKAAEMGHSAAQYNLGMMYCHGREVIENFVEAYKWILVSGIDYDEIKVWLRSNMTPLQVAEAQKLAQEFVDRRSKETGDISNDQTKSSVTTFGTGFFFSTNGLFLTAAHVVKDATSIKVYWHEKEYDAENIFVDEPLDVALLKVSGAALQKSLILSNSLGVKTGDAVFTLGFPQVQLQGIEPKYTNGSISSLSGSGSDPKYFQVSVPVQPGNSGGPLLNDEGHVIGMINSRLDDINTLRITGAIPQNVNYALKSSFILTLLESLPQMIEGMEKPAKPDTNEAIERAKHAVALVVCYGQE